MRRTILSFVCNETGATAIEYGLIAAGIAVAIIAVVSSLGSTLNTRLPACKQRSNKAQS